MNDPNGNFPMHVGIVVTSAAQLASVYALLGGVALAAVTTAPKAEPKTAAEATMPEVAATATTNAPAPAPAAEQSDPSVVDAHGHPWSPDLHASTKTQTKEGLWRMKVGVSRPEPLPGFPKETGGTGTSANGAGTPVTGTATNETAGPATDAEDDEFAAFRAAAEKSNATDAAAAASVPARKWSDADLGKLCNQAAVKLGDPAPIKEIIGDYIPEGQVAHSRNIPEGDREAFAKAVEAHAGITFEG